MKEMKRNNFFLPEEKKYLLWIFLGLFTLLLLEVIIYPKIQKKETYQTLIKNYQKELEEMNSKISESMIKKEELENIEANLVNLSYQGNILSLIKKTVISQMPNSFKLINITTEKYIDSNEMQIQPMYIEFTSNKNDISIFLSKLNALQLPMGIVDLKIDGLSPQDISVKIQLIFEKRN